MTNKLRQFFGRHKILFIWIGVFFLLIYIGVILSDFYMDLIIIIIIILIEILISFLFYPIFIFDNRLAKRYGIKQKNKEINNASNEISEKYCKYCGEKVDMGAIICPYCGSDLKK